MPSFNQINIMGNLCRDPEMSYTPSGKGVCKFSIAVNERWKGEDGQDRERVDFFDVTAWGRSGEVIAEHLAKGSPIFITGKLRQETWEDKSTGQKRSRCVIMCNQFQFVGGKRDDDDGSGGSQRRSAPARTQRQAQPTAEDGPPPDDDVPF